MTRCSNPQQIETLFSLFDDRQEGTIIAHLPRIASRKLPSVHIDYCPKENHSTMNVEPSRQIKKTKPQVATSTAAQTQSPSATPAQTRQRLSPCDDPHILIAKRAYELFCERGYRHGGALDDWLDAEREILSQIPPV
jgi:Protein of unknown function (DUF2934)